MSSSYPSLGMPPLSAAEIRLRRARNRRLALWISLAVLVVIGGGMAYLIHLSNNLGPAPALPPAPPHAQVLSHTSGTDMLEGNFVLTMALYRTNASPSALVAYYKHVLRSHPHQIGAFTEHAYTTLPAHAPEALQHVPAMFIIPVAGDPNAADYLYTEYHEGDSDVGVAIDQRHPHGPTLVYMEMLTLPSA